jgi:hypothetical protein
MKRLPTMPMELQTTRELVQQEPAAILVEPSARREAHSSELMALRCSKESMTYQTMSAPPVPMEVLIRELVRQEPAAISMEPPGRRDAHSSEPTALRCPKESKTCQMKQAPPVPMEVRTRVLLSQKPAAISMEPPGRREAHSSEPTALRFPKESKTCQMKQAPTVSMEVLTRKLPSQNPAAISMEPPGRREAHSSEPTAPHCPKESKTCQKMSAPPVPMEVLTRELLSQKPAAISIEQQARREAHSSEPSALRCPKQSKTCRMKRLPTMPMEARTTQELVQQEPAAILVEPPARREAHSSEPTALRCSKESKT